MLYKLNNFKIKILMSLDLSNHKHLFLVLVTTKITNIVSMEIVQENGFLSVQGITVSTEFRKKFQMNSYGTSILYDWI